MCSHVCSCAGAIVLLESGKKMRARCLIGADGANSRVARALNVPKPNYAGYTAYRLAAKLNTAYIPARCKSH